MRSRVDEFALSNSNGKYLRLQRERIFLARPDEEKRATSLWTRTKLSLRLPRRKERMLLPVKGAFVVLSNYVFTLDVVEPANGSVTPCKLIQPGYASRISREELS